VGAAERKRLLDDGMCTIDMFDKPWKIEVGPKNKYPITLKVMALA